jgi:hypothetical protein
VTLHIPLFCQPTVSDPAIDYSGQEFRQYARAMLTSGTGVGGEQGVTSAASMAVTQRGAGANLSVDVASGLAYIVGDDVSNQGTYQEWNDGTVNVTGWTVPGAGTFHHRLCLQVQDKLNNGAFSGYVANFVPVLDSGGGLPAEPASAITLATIDIAAGAVSIVNANINDYRQRVGPVSAPKAGDTGRAFASPFTDDPDLQLLNLQASATYALSGHIGYTGFNDTGGNLGSLTWKFRVSSGTTMSYTAPRLLPGSAGTVTAGYGFVAGDSPQAGTFGVSNLNGVALNGTITTGAAPAFVVLQWMQASLQAGTATTVKAGSLLRARRTG